MTARALAIRWIALLGVCGLGLPSAASAEDEFEHRGTHVGVGLALGAENFDLSGTNSFDAGRGVSAWLGHRPNRWLGGELQLSFVQVEGESTTVEDGQSLTTDVDLLSTTLTANAKAFPLADLAPDWLEPYALAGGGLGWSRLETRTGASSADRTDVGFVGRFGGGADIFLSHDKVSLGVAASYVLTTRAIEDTDYVLFVFGLQYRLD